MGYDAKPTVDDVVMTISGEGEATYMALYLRVGEAGKGDTVGEWRGGEIERMLDLGLFRRGGPGPLAETDGVLLGSVLGFCRNHRFRPLADFEASLRKGVASAEEWLEAAHEGVALRPLAEGGDPIDQAVVLAVRTTPFPFLSAWRRADLHRHLREVLESRLAANQSLPDADSPAAPHPGYP